MSWWCCCQSCTISSDTFDRSDSGTTSWDELSGSWEILSNRMHVTAAGVALYPTAFPPAATQQLAGAVVNGQEGDVLRVLVAADSEDDYLAAEVEIGETCGYLRLISVEGGAETELAEVPIRGVAPDEDHALMACYAPGTGSAAGAGKLVGVLQLADGRKVTTAAAATGIGDQAGLAATAVGTGGADFDDFRMALTNADQEGCTPCEPDCVLVQEDWGGSGTLGCPWEIVSGTWTGISTSSAGALTVYRGEVATGEGTYAGISFGTRGVIRVVADYVDEDNYHYLELDQRTGEIAPFECKLYRRAGGTDTLLDTQYTTTVAEFLYLYACDGHVLGVVDSAKVLHSPTTLHGGLRVGFGTGAAHAESFAPLTFTGRRTNAICGCPPEPVETTCGACSGKVITQINLVIPAATVVAGGASDTIAGTYVLSLDPTNSCRWSGDFGVLSPKDESPAGLSIELTYEIHDGALAFHGTISIGGVGSFVRPPADDTITDFNWGRYSGAGTGCGDVPRVQWLPQSAYDVVLGDSSFGSPVDHPILTYDGADRSVMPRIEIYEEDA